MRIFVLILLVIGVVYGDRLSSSWPIRFGQCIDPAVSTNFRVNDFFTKKWYNWRAYGNFLFARSGSCQGMEATSFGDFKTVEGETKVQYTEFEGLYFPVTFNLFGKLNFTTALTILGTDYDNWAAVYFCDQGLGFKAEMSWLMMRDWRAEVSPALEEQVRTAVEKVGLDFSSFQPQDRTHCGKGEPHL